MRNLAMPRVLGAVSTWLGLALALGDTACPSSGPNARPTHVQPFVMVENVPLHISTLVTSNTEFVVDGTTFSVTNAPTVFEADLLTTTTATYMSTL